MNQAIDNIQQRLTSYACDLDYPGLSPEAIHAAKLQVIDTLGALIGGFFGDPCHVARKLASQTPDPDGATVIGTRIRTTPDLAAFVNATTARYAELLSVYHWPGSFGGHPGDTLTPVLAAAEHARVNGREFITSVVLAYEVYARISDVFKNEGFDHTTFSCLATALATGKLFGLSQTQLAHCISMAVVPNNILRQVRRNQQTMFKAAASGQAGRGGVFAALLARAGMEGPHLPFEGKAGWCDHVAAARFTLTDIGGNGTAFKILDARIKNRRAAGIVLASILAAEKLAPLDINKVERVTVEVHKIGKERLGSGEQARNPSSPQDANHSAPYLVAATLRDGTVTMRSFDDSHLWNPQLRALMQKIAVVENDEFTKDYQRIPQAHRARVTVVTDGGQWLVGEAGRDGDDLSTQRSDAQVVAKFRGLAEDSLGTKRIDKILERLWHLEDMESVAEIPAAFVLG